MPRKIRQLIKDYRKAGFNIHLDGGKGSHRKIIHREHDDVLVILSGHDGEDAHHYMERDLCTALQALAARKKK